MTDIVNVGSAPNDGTGDPARTAFIAINANLKKNNFAATTAPTVSNDNTEGYEIGSRWFDITAQIVYECENVSTGAAVWLRMMKFSDASLAGAGFFLDEDNMASDSATKVPSQQSVKAYVDTMTRELLTANRTYYVRTDGNDANTGLVDSAGGAFLTIQKAIDVVSNTLDFGGYTVTIQVRDGTYTGVIAIDGEELKGDLVLLGNTGTPANVLISTSATAISVTNPGASVSIAGFKIASSAGSGIYVASSAKAVLGEMDYGVCALYHVHVELSYVEFTSSYTISGGALIHLTIGRNGVIYRPVGLTVTLTGTPAFGTAFALVDTGGALREFTLTYSGSATGVRYIVQNNGVINASGAAETYFPGNAAGQMLTGGVYSGPTPYPIQELLIAVSDETTALTTGNGKVTFRMPNYATLLVDVLLSVTTAPTGAGILMDLNEAGSSVFSTRPGIDATEKTSVTGTAAVISDPDLAADAEMRIDIDQVGSTIAGAGAKMRIYYRRKA